ncbi:precorrin-6A/cobalt-precorrin-6A reductase [Saccharomonospora amisosensis]|uniref:Precorrin-6A/cobalt-precorrin-6A reductase n=1 Tax=Saccharomonospora amisosensis TaxID=1128677 RepID=A0A7X5ZSA5_9PSEU|nr:cobalt-precorrin-6A reductase [Saccharomonospora amisosensis]NIJ13718.1 precorrin-6A/cobalt-precorrin-6A reductase [Saccharomonospora amisosensis]
MASIARLVLILGGTSEARALAAALVASGVRVVSSLAGRVASPRLPEGEVRVGGFGGPNGLAGWLTEYDITAVVDATHPFAERIGESAVRGTALAGVPLLRLERPGWVPTPGDDWHWVDTLREAAAVVPSLGSRAFLTSGRQGLSAFAHASGVWFLARCVDPPEPPLPPRLEVLLSRGPYRVADELALLREHRIEVLVTKDSGGSLTSAKLTAARQLRVPVVVVRRPPRAATESVTSVDAAEAWVLERVRDHPHARP